MEKGKPDNPEIMADFFNVRAKTYENHQKESIESFEQFYDSISSCIPETKSKIRILDIGCGTGLELDGILKRIPNAVVTAVDISMELLNRLVDRFKDYSNQITPIQGSYLEFHFRKRYYDYVIAIMTLHHLLHDTKRELYRRIMDSLKPGGLFIEGDFIVSKGEERKYLSRYEEISKNNSAITNGSHHIDIPMTLETQKQLLIEVGFSTIDVIWKGSRAAAYIAKP